MGHSRAEIYDRYYVSQYVKKDIQAAYLGTPSKNALIGLVSHMSITRDPRAPTHLNKQQVALCYNSEEVKVLEEEHNNTKRQIIVEYGSVKDAAGSDIYARHQKLIAQIASEKARQRRLLEAELRTEYFNTIDTLEIDRQRSGAVSEYLEPQPTYILKERQCLADLLCQSSDPLDDE